MLTLNGSALQNMGMALFPRKVNCEHLMLSRQDDENLFLMRSTNLHHWENPQLLTRPAEVWESVKIGNCGSLVETEIGRLVLPCAMSDKASAVVSLSLDALLRQLQS